jgi:hypothetical protein
MQSPPAKKAEGAPRTPSRGSGSGTEAPSPLSKASTPQRHRDDSAGAECAPPRDLASALAEGGDAGAAPSVSGKCRLLAWAADAYRRSRAETEGGADGCAIHPAKESDLWQKRERRRSQATTAHGHQRARWFGEYSEDDPDEYLLIQDLIALHRRGVEDISVTIITDDEPFDVEPLVGHAGMADLDAQHLVESADDILASYTPDSPGDWLLYQDLVAVARRGAARASVTILMEAEDEPAEGDSLGSEKGHLSARQEEGKGAEPAAGALEYEADLCGEFEYDEENPEVCWGQGWAWREGKGLG